MLLLLAAHCAAALAAPALVRWFGRTAFLPLALVPLAAAAWALPPWLRGDRPRVEEWAWIPDLDLELALRADALGWLMVLIVGGVGAFIVAYCARYFGAGQRGVGALAGELLAFAAAMLGLVLADDLILLYVFWELTTVLSYLLVGFDAERAAARKAATQAIVVTTFGGLAMLVGLIMLGREAGTFRISAIVAGPPQGTAVSVALVLVLAGALSKSAIMPFGLWLPGAMAAPTPVSAFLHAAAMVKAGVYLVARLAPAFAAVPVWRPLVLGLGGATMLLAGWRALREHDLKLVLAYGTVSQLGFLTVLTGAGWRTAALAGVTMLLAHALFKATLFMVVGIVDHATGTRDLRELSGLARRAPVVCGAAVAAAASMAGIPATLGFAGKEAAYEAFVEGHAPVLTVLVVGSAFTAAYSLRFLWGAFARKPGVADTAWHRPGPLLLFPPVVLAAACVLLGLFVAELDAPLGRSAGPYPAGDYHLSAWHGVGAALLLSVISLALGAGLFGARSVVTEVQRRLVLFEPSEVYRRIMRGLTVFAVQLTGAVQRGSLPGYLLVILITAASVTAGALAFGGDWPAPSAPRWWDGPAQGMVVALTVAAAVAAVRATGRSQTVVLAGASGYGVGTLFVLQGAPDLALTQFLVETVSLLVFVLVLRRLPTGALPRAPRPRRTGHLAVGVLSGLLATTATLLAVRSRTAPSISAGFPAAAEQADAANIVATTLVDMRAWDTLGESSVVALAAIGVTSMVFAGRRVRGPRRAREADAGTAVWSVQGINSINTSGGRGDTAGQDAEGGLEAGVPRERAWLAAGGTLAAERRSIIVEVVARLVFHTVLLLSLYLLFTAHSAPGGGFAGGIVAGLALAIRYLAGGPFELAEAAPVSVGVLLGVGLVIAAGTGLGGLLWGDSVLASGSWDLDLLVLGHLHVASSLVFDVGVYLIVVGLVLDILNALGAEIDRQAEEDA
ncbi:Na+/H+ antiporter subunit A [Actinomadura hibisca]|uniref:Na+/H+ antiporter subunit A n=1 Tax=Actinomadura hibisca TaxID=68565 RepID=UPI000830412D|nr:Na+/H+ antiporter subunit A [Actinomadura hibisca]